MLYKTTWESPLGELLIYCSEDLESLVGLWIKDAKNYGGNYGEEIIEKQDVPLFLQVKEWLEQYFMGNIPTKTSIPFDLRGSEFQKCVWDTLLEIPYGTTTTYGEIGKSVAKTMGRTQMSAQAIGGAIGKNPISIIIPCHRVVGKNGSMTGYAGGIDKKIKLLHLEGISVSQTK